MKTPVVVDTNVLKVAEGASDYSRSCSASCAKLLGEIQVSGVVVLDSNREILTEYGKQLQKHSGQPGRGYQFWKWIINTRASHSSCVCVQITPHKDRGYEEFPVHDGLAGFDRSDRKFIAVSAAHPQRPEIIQAGDSKWWGWRHSLEECGIRLKMPCAAELQAKWEKKIGRNA